MSEKRKILAVDDEPRNLKIVGLALNNEWDLHTAKDGEEAVAMAKSLIPDVILLDIMMPGIDGYEVTQRIRKEKALVFTKIVLVSGKAMLEERLKGYAVGADDYLTKPFAPEELSSKVRVFSRMCVLDTRLFALNENLEREVEAKTRELVMAQAKMISSAKMAALGEMAGGMAHEINTPLATITMISEQIVDMLESKQYDYEQMHKLSKLTGETAMRIAKIIQGLRNFARDGKADPCETYSLESIMEEMTPMCTAKLREGDIKFEVVRSAQPISVYCRSVQVVQAIVNLVGNSADAIRGKPERWIKIETESEADRAIIRVTDSGGGIPKETLEKIFEPFFTTKDVGHGTGLGLSLSKGLLESQGGSLSYNDRSPNTQFVITLPLTAPAVKAA